MFFFSNKATEAPRRLHLLIELGLALASGHLFFLSLFRKYPWPIDWIGRGFLPGALLVFGLACARVATTQEPKVAASPLRARLVPGRWLEGMGRPGLILLGGFLVVFLLLQNYGGRLGNDGTVLFTYVRSLVIDKDLDLRNEFDAFVPEKYQSFTRTAREPGGNFQPPYELGPAFFWLPFYVAAHALVKIGSAFGGSIPADGYSYPYINAVCLGSLCWAFGGVVLSQRIVRRYFDSSFAAWCAVILWLASPLVWYTVFEPTMAHAVSLAGVALFLFTWLRAREKGGLAAWVAVAVSAGLMLSVQRYNVFYLTAPLLTFLGQLRKAVASRSIFSLRRAGVVAVLLILVLLVSTAPLWVYNLTASGVIFRTSENPAWVLGHWKNPTISQFLYSSNHGLFSWTPAALLSVLGLVILIRSKHSIAAVFLVTLSAGVYLLSSAWDPGHSFGSRRLTEAYPIFLLGFCSIVEFGRRSPRLLAGLLGSCLVIWNLVLVAQVRHGEIPQMGTFAFSDAVSRGLEMAYRKVGHPFAFPANWIFAHAHGVTPDRFDTVFGHRAYNNLVIDVGTPSDRYFLGRGWSIPEMTSSGETFRWSDGEHSSWLVSLFALYRYRLRLTGESVCEQSETQRVVLEVNGARVGTLSMKAETHIAEITVPARFVKRGLNEIVFRYLDTVRADELYGGSDPRQIALRLERLELLIEN